jgi:hypothetical protein
MLPAQISQPLRLTASKSNYLTFSWYSGYPNGTAMVVYGQGLRGLIGSAAAIFVIVTMVAALAASLSAGWVRIAWRVFGSWIAASGVLLLGWALH